jgi:hypothetical protein
MNPYAIGLWGALLILMLNCYDPAVYYSIDRLFRFR